MGELDALALSVAALALHALDRDEQVHTLRKVLAEKARHAGTLWDVDSLIAELDAALSGS